MGITKIDVFTRYNVSDEIKKTIQALIVPDEKKIDFLLRSLCVPHHNNQKLLVQLRDGRKDDAVILIIALGMGDLLKKNPNEIVVKKLTAAEKKAAKEAAKIAAKAAKDAAKAAKDAAETAPVVN